MCMLKVVSGGQEAGIVELARGGEELGTKENGSCVTTQADGSDQTRSSAIAWSCYREVNRAIELELL